jgi:hypothetical protein
MVRERSERGYEAQRIRRQAGSLSYIALPEPLPTALERRSILEAIVLVLVVVLVLDLLRRDHGRRVGDKETGWKPILHCASEGPMMSQDPL